MLSLKKNFILLLFFLSLEQFNSLIFQNEIFRIKFNKDNFNNIKKNINEDNLINDNDEECYVYKIENNECGHCKIKKIFLPFAKLFTNLKDGKCQENGYNIHSGQEEINVPVIGQLKINKYKK